MTNLKGYSLWHIEKWWLF